jgi:YHYH protein/Secretion system C-terminal sorting domain
MKKIISLLISTVAVSINAQTNPVITSWLRNTTNLKASHYVSGNSTAIQDNIFANVQTVQYSTSWSYISTNGVPSYTTGPYFDGNPSTASSQNAIFKFPLTPTENTGTKTSTNAGNIGVFKNGVAFFDYRDGASYKSSTGANAGGPLGGTGDGIWNRDAVVAERAGFDCSKGHPAMGNYHHHQNPSAFDLDLTVLSTICTLYDSDGLYVINSAAHSPLLGYAYDGFPVYGAYGYTNVDGTGGISRMKSGYQLRNITVRTHYADGSNVTDGPAVSATYPLGTYREDYEWVSHTGDATYLDIHNGRFCVTPEYPAGTYCYFTTVDANHNSAYPYIVGPTFYGNKTGGKLTGSITETTTTYTGTLGVDDFEDTNLSIKIYPNPATNLIAVQSNAVENNRNVELINELGQVVATKQIVQGSTICFFETDAIANGIYFIKISSNNNSKTHKIIINK